MKARNIYFVPLLENLFREVGRLRRAKITGKSLPGLVYKGFGESEELPEGEDFTLPDGVTYFDTIKGYNASAPGACGCVRGAMGKGIGEAVQICLPLKNDNPSTVTLSLPAGLIFVSKNLAVQNGILVVQVEIEIPPKTSKYVPLYLNCINAGRSFYSTLEDEFEQGKITTVKPVLELLKALSAMNLHADSRFSQYIEIALKEISYGGEVRAETMKILEQLDMTTRIRKGDNSENTFQYS